MHSSVDKYGSRASPAVMLWFCLIRAEAHTEDDNRPRARSSYSNVNVVQMKKSGANFCPRKNEINPVFYRKHTSLIPRVLTVPLFFCLKRQLCRGVDIRRSVSFRTPIWGHPMHTPRLFSLGKYVLPDPNPNPHTNATEWPELGCCRLRRF